MPRLGVVRVVGTGLLGTSIALGLRVGGTDVVLADSSPTSLALARDLGAGRIDDGQTTVDLVVVAAPPDVTADLVIAELAAHPTATVTDVASVKGAILDAVADAGGDLSRYVGGHPMAGRERSGAVSARGDLFLGRPWVLCPTTHTPTERVDVVHRFASGLGANVVTMGPADHDAAVAIISHVPQVMSSLTAARLRDAGDEAVGISGQGLRDVTRVAASDPALWAQILAANAHAVTPVLAAVRAELDSVIQALTALTAEVQGSPALGARADLARVVAAGNVGRDRLPGKHGARPTTYAVLTVMIPDRAGSLGRLFADIGEAGVNIEEINLEHAPGRAVGLLELSVLPPARQRLEAALAKQGWQVVG